MSNLSDYVNAVNGAKGADTSAVGEVGSLLGLAADVSGAFGLASIVIGLVEQLLATNEDVLSDLKQYLVAVHTDLSQFIAAERIDHLLTRLNGLDQFIGDAQGAFEGLKGELNANPPVTNDFKFGQITICRGKVDGLDTDHQFGTNVLDERYYEDAWTGRVAPQQSDFVDTDVAFSAKYILPEFLRTLGYFIAVGGAFDQHFVENNRDGLQRYLNRLDGVYAKSVQNIVTIRPPTQDELLGNPVHDDVRDQDVYQAFEGGAIGPWARAGNPLPGMVEPNSEFYQMYGAVDRFVGFFAVGNHPLVPLPDPNVAPAPDDFYPRFAAILAIRTLNAWKLVFLHLGLPALRDSRNTVRALLGQPPLDPLERPSGQWWSLRETHDALGNVFADPNPVLFQVTAAETIGRMAALIGVSGPLSWRAALAGVLIPMTLDGPPAP
jgi:hypothetical protein